MSVAKSLCRCLVRPNTPLAQPISDPLDIGGNLCNRLLYLDVSGLLCGFTNNLTCENDEPVHRL
jgi:hypothetical protein